jgi:hypothetical protein
LEKSATGQFLLALFRLVRFRERPIGAYNSPAIPVSKRSKRALMIKTRMLALIWRRKLVALFRIAEPIPANPLHQ